METIFQLRKQHIGKEPEVINTKIGKAGYGELADEKKVLRAQYPDRKNVAIWITPLPAKVQFQIKKPIELNPQKGA